MKNDECLWQRLLDAGFQEKVKIKPITKVQTFLNKFYYRCDKFKPQERTFKYWLTHVINGKVYDVRLIDIWYINLCIDDVCVFDARRFEDEEFFKLFPKEFNI